MRPTANLVDKSAGWTRWRRLPAGRQALPAPAHLRLGHPYAQLAAGFEMGVSTVYSRYITEAVGLPAAPAPDLATAITNASAKAFVTLDGTLLPRRAGHGDPEDLAPAAELRCSAIRITSLVQAVLTRGSSATTSVARRRARPMPAPWTACG